MQHLSDHADVSSQGWTGSIHVCGIPACITRPLSHCRKLISCQLAIFLPLIFSTPNSFPTLPLPLKTSYPATTRHYLISSTFVPHSSPNSLLMPTTPGSPHTSKHLKPFAGTSSMFTSAPSTPHLEPKPSPISNKPPRDTIN